MTEKKKAPSMKVAAATQKLSQAELQALLKNAEGATDELADEEEGDELPPPAASKATPKKKR